MFRLLLQFWPVLVPLLIYAAWQLRQRRRAARAGETKPGWLEGPWYWAALAAIAVAMASFIGWGLSNEPAKGHYIPPHVEDGTVVPGRLAP